MNLPLGFDEARRGELVCKLKRCLYGLKQPPRAWFDRHQDNKTTILIVYVDDIILIRDDVDGMKRLKGALATEFKIKDLIEVLLAMEVIRNKTVFEGNSNEGCSSRRMEVGA
ncbi:Retrovirus-related Pol polyprotein from transposon TNT 1-94 [Vitis vinifera]|uniref:Retrovirus-related Pol polyprotein from transposon TNT 1-94 n=1 Tax=Vitis vinifera TaxID=29760 RepID=A0A438BPL0_VITVI|nr:Retrovirus-related Pol polyprotein from transposon TNT 1-94 [Vitis vinifera]